MDRLTEAVAEYLCRHKSVGLLRLTLDLTRRRLDIFAEVGAVEVVRDSGHRNVMASRRQRGGIRPPPEGAGPVVDERRPSTGQVC